MSSGLVSAGAATFAAIRATAVAGAGGVVSALTRSESATLERRMIVGIRILKEGKGRGYRVE